MASAFIIRTFDTTALGSQDYQRDLTQELISLVPESWTSAPAKQQGGVFYAVMGAIGLLLADIRTSIDTFKAQLRLLTARADGLDTIAQDYFGMDPALALPRSLTQNLGGGLDLESDETYRARIDAELLHPRATVQGVIDAITRLIGASPTIFEPFNAQSAAVYGDSLYGVDYPNGASWHTTVPNNLSTTTKVYVTATTHIGAGSLIEVVGFATAGGVQLQALTAAPGSDGGGSFITLPTALTRAPGLGVQVISKGTTAVSTGSTVSKLYVVSTDLIFANSYVAIANATQASGSQKPFFVSSIGSDGGGPFINLVPSLSAVPSTGTQVFALGQPVYNKTTGILSGPGTGFPLNVHVRNRPVLQYTTTLDGCTASLLRVNTIGGVTTGARVFVDGFTPNNLTVGFNAILDVDSTGTIFDVDSAAGYLAGDTVLVTTTNSSGQPITSTLTFITRVLSPTQVRVAHTIPDLAVGTIANFNVLPLSGALSGAPGAGVAITVVNTPQLSSFGPGFDALGDAGVKYTFVVNINSNPKSISRARILDVLNRVRPAGVKAILTGVN